MYTDKSNFQQVITYFPFLEKFHILQTCSTYGMEQGVRNMLAAGGLR